MPQIGVKLPYLPGHFILIRGALVGHETTRWEGEGRVGLVFFEHVEGRVDLGLEKIDSLTVHPV